MSCSGFLSVYPSVYATHICARPRSFFRGRGSVNKALAFPVNQRDHVAGRNAKSLREQKNRVQCWPILSLFDLQQINAVDCREERQLALAQACIFP